ncbi:hypothetical protein GCM10009558_055930 [Virgisporangium aurantiacum]
MQVDQAGQRHQAVAVDTFDIDGRTGLGAGCGDLAVLQQQIGRRPVEDPDPGDQICRRHLTLPSMW